MLVPSFLNCKAQPEVLLVFPFAMMNWGTDDALSGSTTVPTPVSSR
jgi:hypothetical protein